MGGVLKEAKQGGYGRMMEQAMASGLRFQRDEIV